MPDFGSLLRKPAGEAKRPPTLPPGDYPGILKRFEWGESNQRKTPYLRYFVGLLDWPADAPSEWDETDENGKVWHYSRGDVDLSKRQQTFEFYFPKDEQTGEPTENSLWRYDEFLRSAGISPSGKTYEELVPETIGAQVLVVMKQELNQQSNRLFTRADRMTGIRS